jgi:hypothetical protein
MTNTTLQIILTFVGILGALGLFAGGIGFLWTKIRGGSKEAKTESTDLLTSNDQIKQFYKEQNDDLKEINKVLGEKVDALTREVGEIRGQLIAEKTQNERLEKIFQNRDPETKQFMEFMMQAVKDQSQVAKDQSESHKEIVRVLGEIHTMSKMEHERDFSISATVTKQ